MGLLYVMKPRLNTLSSAGEAIEMGCYVKDTGEGLGRRESRLPHTSHLLEFFYHLFDENVSVLRDSFPTLASSELGGDLGTGTS